MKISVLTSTYNRKNEIVNLYASLIQNSKYGFEIEWLIMDDGSTDGTQETIEKLPRYENIQIKYFSQENQGKMAALNNLVQYAQGDITIECDSDDYFYHTAFKYIKDNLEKFMQDETLYAMCFLKYNQDLCNIGNLFKKDGQVSKLFDLYYKQGLTGDKALVFKTKIRKQYSYILEKQEKFSTEARMFHKMDKDYNLMCINQPIMICEYRQDGYSQNIKKVFMKNPYGYFEFFKEIFEMDVKGVTLKKRLYVIKHYILFSYLTSAKNILKNVKGSFNKILTTFLYIPGIIMSKIKFNKKFNKLFFAAYNLEIGGVETALISLLNHLVKQYDITLLLEKKQGELLDLLNTNIKIIEYKTNQSKNVLIRKSINLFKRILFILKYKNKFGFAVSYATSSKADSFTARTASKNNCLWVHSNYMTIYKKDKQKVKEFFDFVSIEKFKNIVCVSHDAKNALLKIYPMLNISVINNLIDDKSIIEKSQEEIDLSKSQTTTFLSVARHEEDSKRLTRLIKASSMLKNDEYDFKVLLVGDGQDTEKYKNMVKEEKIEDKIIFVGRKLNPYPYFKISDVVILTSEYEGYPVIYNEAKILNIPIITTDVSDAKIDIENRYGIVTKKDTDSIYTAMKEFINNGYEIKEKFDAKRYNNDILKQLEKMF